MSKTTMVVDGVEYVRADSVRAVETSGRVLLVIDRGWIFAGDLEADGDHYVLHRSVNVERWTGGQGISGVIADPKTDVTLRAMPAPVRVPRACVLYSVALIAGWGLSDG